MKNKKMSTTFWLFIAGAIGLLGLGAIKLFFPANVYQGILLIGFGILAIIILLLIGRKPKKK